MLLSKLDLGLLLQSQDSDFFVLHYTVFFVLHSTLYTLYTVCVYTFTGFVYILLHLKPDSANIKLNQKTTHVSAFVCFAMGFLKNNNGKIARLLCISKKFSFGSGNHGINGIIPHFQPRQDDTVGMGKAG